MKLRRMFCALCVQLSSSLLLRYLSSSTLPLCHASIVPHSDTQAGLWAGRCHWGGG